jgi:hypothetical protein
MGKQSIDDQKWHHYAITYSKKCELTLYVDGKVEETKIPATKYENAGVDLFFGFNKYGNSPYYLDGCMAEIKIYKTCRSKSKIKKDMNYKGISSKCILYYSFNKKIKKGGKVKDLSGKKNHGELLNGVVEKIKK